MTPATTRDIFDQCVPSVPTHVRAGGAVVTIGNYDGVHLGHRAILASARERADAAGLPLLALTFTPHPATVFGGVAAGDLRLSSDEERERLLVDAGVDLVLTIAFTRTFASIEAETFITELLIDRLGACEVHVGYDFNYGRGRRGNSTMMRNIGGASGLTVVEHEAVTLDGEPVSSTRVRHALRAGDIAEVSRLLGRPWHVTGISLEGAGRGREIGIPTVNLYPSDRLLPPHGVYVTELSLGDASWDAITNVGTRPTFTGDDRVSVETLALSEFPDDVHGEHVGVQFLSSVRAERAFASADALREQIARDVEVAKAFHRARARG